MTATVHRGACGICKLTRLPLDDTGRLAPHAHPSRLPGQRATCPGSGEITWNREEPTR